MIALLARDARDARDSKSLHIDVLIKTNGRSEAMLRGDEVEYTKDLSPYGSPHVVEDELQYVSYKDYGAKFKPNKPVTVGATVVAVDDNVLWVAKVTKIKRRPRTKGMSCWITLADGDKKIMKKNKLTGVPGVREYVRQISTGIWFQVQKVGQMIEIAKILVSPPEKEGLLHIMYYLYCLFLANFPHLRICTSTTGDSSQQKDKPAESGL